MKVDGHLLIDLKNGDEKAFETLFWKYNEHVYHFIYSLLYECKTQITNFNNYIII